MMSDSLLRVSVATYNRVVFPHPQDGTLMLALERKGTVLTDGSVNVRAQPFGGGVRILNSNSLTDLLGGIQFDSERSKDEGDFRILIPPAKWEAVKQYCLLHLANPDDADLESTPERELAEEFAETMGADLKRSQYTFEPMGLVVEDEPVFTENWYARGFPTVRVYRTYRVNLLDENLCRALLYTSQWVSDQELGGIKNERGRANTVLALSLSSVTESWLALPPEARYRRIKVDGHDLDESVLAVLDVDVPQYRRVNA